MESATFSSDGFVNQLSLNPVHTWFDSLFDFDIRVCSFDEAVALVQRELSIRHPSGDSPVARSHHFPGRAKPVNVVLVLMESMCASKMGAFGQNPNNLTPFLDSLARNSVFFDSCFSNGIHTNAGLYSTLYGMPIMMMQHPMYNGVSEHTSFSGLPVTLKDKGYETIFFCSHPKSFDNLDGFLEKNGFQTMSDITDYPEDKIANSWGVGDETLLEHAASRLTDLDRQGKPFFATILTITAHPPYTYPEFSSFRPRSSDPIEATYEYADWSLRHFMDSCARQPWYENTVFVFVGDHGMNPKGPQDVPINYNHVPLIFHAPKLLNKPELRHQLANQTDIYPTIMGLLDMNYTQNSLGYDLFRERRPYAFFSQDHKLGVLNERFLYVARKSGKETLYDYRNGYGIDVKAQHPELTKNMKDYATSMLQVSQWMIREKKNGLVK